MATCGNLGNVENRTDKSNLAYGHRQFYALPKREKQVLARSDSQQEKDELFRYIEENIIGNDLTFSGPYGRRCVIYCDYIASGRALRFIEDFISCHVLPEYGNTHTTTTVTSLQTTLHRHEARDIVRNAVNASEHDSVIFVGSGCTGAIHKLIHSLNLEKRDLKPIVLVGPYEHHSNMLPWKESGSEVISIPEGDDGLIDTGALESHLQKHEHSGRMLIGTFAAASNITGTLVDTDAVTILLHKYGALAFWDYATAAPYVKIDMNPVIQGVDRGLSTKDAIFFSVHKFIGGVQSPGVLVAKTKLFVNPVPSGSGGGTVFFVRREAHRYLKEIEMREEGGTPDIVGSIRAGLVFQLKEAIGSEFIIKKEHELTRLAFDCWKNTQNLVLLGSRSVPRLPVFSFLIRHPESGYFLHYNFVCAILNDMFGIQSRGGCACAGPYAQNLLGIDEELAEKIENIMLEDDRLDRTHLRRYGEYNDKEILRPGFVRLNLPYFMDKDAISYVLEAVQLTAQEGWKLLPQVFKERKWLGNISYKGGQMNFTTPVMTSTEPLPESKQDCLRQAKDIFEKAPKFRSHIPDSTLVFDEDAQSVRWFLLPYEAYQILQQRGSQQPVNPPFCPKTYLDLNSVPVLTTNDSDFSLPLGDSPSRINGCLSIYQSHNNPMNSSSGTNPEGIQALTVKRKEKKHVQSGWHVPPKKVIKPTVEAINEFNMIQDGDRVLVCLSGGKDSLSLLHTIKQLQYSAKHKGINYEFGAVTVDPQVSSYDPSPLIGYLACLDVPYFFESQGILETARNLPYQCDSICSFCSRMKRGIIYNCARREGYNVLAMGQHLDDLAESFLMSIFHNGNMRTMKANYTVKTGDLRVIRPFVYVREKQLREFAEQERHRCKQLLAGQELLFPHLYSSIQAAIKPIISINSTGVNAKTMFSQHTRSSEQETE